MSKDAPKGKQGQGRARYSLNATATRDLVCRCGGLVRKGDRLLMYRERALSSAEASHAGTAYPFRRLCASCAAAKAESNDGIPEDVSARCEAEECTRAGEVLGKRGLLCIECARESERAS